MTIFSHVIRVFNHPVVFISHQERNILIRLFIVAAIFLPYLALCEPGQDVQKNHEEAISLLKTSNDPTALDKAVVILQKNVSLGFAPSESTLAVLYSTGNGVPVDSNKSLELLKKASEQGLDKAQHNLALSLLKQSPPQTEQAIVWMEKAAIQGFLLSQKQLAEIYYFGEKGLPKDLKRAKQWANLAACQGDSDSENMMGVIVKSEDIKEAISWFEKAAQVGNTKAQANLGILLLESRETRPDGLAWLYLSADQNEPLAIMHLNSYKTENMNQLKDEAEKRLEIIRKRMNTPSGSPTPIH